MTCSYGDAKLWVHTPVSQQASGAWVDDIYRERIRETPLFGKPNPGDPIPRQRVELFRGINLEEHIDSAFYRRGWTDGLPIVVPTVERVHEMLRYSTLSPQSVLGEMDPLRGIATAEKLAANAVMAGCKPAYFPVVLTAAKAILLPEFNLRGVQTTDENVTPLIIVNGPIVQRLGINGGIGALGPGWRANATIGRAIRLIMQNIGGGWPGVVSLAGIAQPARYTLCIAELEEKSPWPPLHVDAGLTAETSAITILRAESSINVTGDLSDIVSVMGSATSAFSILHGGKVCVLLGPATALKLSKDGFTKQDVAKYLFDHARIPIEQWETLWIKKNIGASYGFPSWVGDAEVKGSIPVVQRWQDIIIFVAGGDAPIAQHVYFPTWGFPPCHVTVPIDLPRDWDLQDTNF